MPNQHRHSVAIALAFTLLLGLTWWAFSPGLKGEFLFDDLPNLSPLSHALSAPPQSILNFVFSGFAGPGGRPVALATFLLEGANWPDDAYPFKRSNLLFHLLTGLSLLCLARRLLILGGIDGVRREWLALIATALWLLHPMQTATLFLVVQRMTILCTLFGTLALLAGLRAQEHWASGTPRRAIPAAALAVLLAILAYLSKETAAVLPLLAAVIERKLAPLPNTRGGRNARWLLLWLPSIVVAAYFFFKVPLTQYIEWRGYTPLDRLWTEGFILLDYLRQILLPGISASLFHDTYPVRGWTAIGPWCLLPWLGIVLACLWAWFSHNRWLAFGVLYFFAGHLLEAGPLPLELYFLHRNYQPMFGLLLGLVAQIASLPSQRWGDNAALLRLAPPIIAITICATLTRLTSHYWGDQGVLLNVWAAEHPDSTRARLSAASYWANQNDPRRALRELRELLAVDPKVATADIASYYLECLIREEDPAHWQRIIDRARQNGYRYDSALTSSLPLMARRIREKSCTHITFLDLATFVDALTETSAYSQKDKYLLYAQLSVTLAEAGEVAPALGAAERSLQERSDETIWRLVAGLRETMGDKQGALDALIAARDTDPRRGLGRWVLDDGPRKAELAMWIARLREEIQHPTPASPPSKTTP